MKKKGLIEDTMHFLVHNSFLFTVAIMCLVHAILLGITWYGKVMPLAYFNILSVVVYMFCILLCNLGMIMPVYISIILEVSVYSAIAVRFMGLRSASYNFLFSIVPIIIYFGNYLFKEKKRVIIAVSLIFDFSVFVYLYLHYYDAAPVYDVSYAVETSLVIFSTFVMLFSVIFYNLIYIYSSENVRNALEKKNEMLTVETKEDALTKLLNRRGFLPIVEGIMNEESEHHFCMAFCDIDNFKRINDNYGHDCGDEVLRHISRLITREMQGCEVCRWGGEEIVILMRDHDLEVAKQKMEYLRKSIESTPTVFYNKRIAATVTIGLEECREDYKKPDDIIKTADARMYYGKQHGKNIVIFEDK